MLNTMVSDIPEQGTVSLCSIFKDTSEHSVFRNLLLREIMQSYKNIIRKANTKSIKNRENYELLISKHNVVLMWLTTSSG